MHPYITTYKDEYKQIITHADTNNEETIRIAFINLINNFAKDKGLKLVSEVRDINTHKIPDGTLRDQYQFTYGHYEAKDPKDNLDTQIHLKIHKRKYPIQNILFENAEIAVLYQEDKEVDRIDIQANPNGLEQIIERFLSFKHTDRIKFYKAIKTFKANIPTLTETLRKNIAQVQSNTEFTSHRDQFLKQCRKEINPAIQKEDIREMIIQHFLTARLFNSVFSETDFHRNNNVAKQIETLCNYAFSVKMKKAFERNNAHFYEALKKRAVDVKDHHDKQRFLKVLYEEFYKAYNPKGADRLGVIYTPAEIVQFIIKSADYFLYKYFNTGLSEKGVNILDPATGTGTFMADLVDFIEKGKLRYKYKNELFCNEISILPYYIAALNIEYTYWQRMGRYKEFPNIAFVDTLDNHMALDQTNHQQLIGFKLTLENTRRIMRQNKSKISVIMGNPPYNAKQQNYNDLNANREYKEIDKRIKESFSKQSMVTNKVNLYDIYVRFYRYAMDRLDKEQGGIVAFVTNNSFIIAQSFDGFRKIVYEEFDYIYVVDLGGNIRKNMGDKKKIGNVFDIQVGVCISFFIKTPKERNPYKKLFYYELADEQSKKSKLYYLENTLLWNIDFQTLYPDKYHNWLNITHNDFEDLVSACSKETKYVKESDEEKAIFKLFSNGVKTGRDEWVYDFDKNNLEKKILFFTDIYEKVRKDSDFKDKYIIKWSVELDICRERNIKKNFEKHKIIKSLYRPFIKKELYFDKHFNQGTYQNPTIWGLYGERKNKVILFPGLMYSKGFML